MDTILSESAFTYFASSLCCLSAAGLIYAATCRGALGNLWLWLAGCAALEGWADLMATFTRQLGESQVWPLLQLLAWTAALVALIEFGRALFVTERRYLPGRWVYPLIALAAVPAFWLGGERHFELGVRIALAVQGCLLSGTYLWQQARAGQTSVTFDRTITVIILSGYSLSTALGIVPLRALVAMAAVGSIWWLSRRSQSAAERGGIVWQGSLPAAFLLLVVVGFVLLPGNASDALDTLDEPVVAEAFDSEGFGGGLEGAAGPADTLKQLGSCGLAIALPVLFGLIAWGLSRIPAFRT